MRYTHLVAAIGAEKQESLRNKTVTIIGLGGIGSSLAELMVRSGVNVRLIEKGRVEEEDLDRLSLFSESDLTKFKATVAKKLLNKINSEVKIKSFNEEITEEALFLLDSDLILDCSSDPELTDLVSKYCEEHKMLSILGFVRDTKCVVVTASEKSPVYKQIKSLDIEQTEGLIPATTHIVAGFMYVKALKLLIGEKPKQGLIIYDSWKQQFEDKAGKKK